MSKIYDNYIHLKSNDDGNTLYLFKYGIFFIFIDEDANIASNILNLKLSHLNDTIVKCGFHVNYLEKYIKLLQTTSYSVQIVYSNYNNTLSPSEFIYNESLKSLVNSIIQLDIDSLSISEAFEFLHTTQNKIKSITNTSSV